MEKNTAIFILIVIILVAFGLSFYYSQQQNAPMGVLEGKVSVGPICPVEQVNLPCPVPPSVYTSRELIVYQADGQTPVARQNFSEQGTYHFDLTPGTYIVDISHTGGFGSSKDLPQGVTIKANQTTEFDFSIDTGIR